MFDSMRTILLAVLLNQRLFGRNVIRTVLFLPVVLSFVAIGVIWTLFFNFDYGVLNAVLKALGLSGLKQDWLGSAARGRERPSHCSRLKTVKRLRKATCR